MVAETSEEAANKLAEELEETYPGLRSRGKHERTADLLLHYFCRIKECQRAVASYSRYKKDKEDCWMQPDFGAGIFPPHFAVCFV